MEFKEKSNNVERVYSVYYDNKKLKELLDKIVRKASYKIDGEFTAPYNASFEGNTFTSRATLPNGDPMYENIKRIYCYTSIIEGILHEDPNSIYAFLNYETHDELVPIDEKIAIVNKTVDEIDNFEFDQKVNALNNLKQLCEDKKSKKYFDVELLKQYYSQACSLLELQLVSEKTIKNGDRILLKDYKTTK